MKGIDGLTFWVVVRVKERPVRRILRVLRGRDDVRNNHLHVSFAQRTRRGSLHPRQNALLAKGVLAAVQNGLVLK